jgi:hypothetical protein
MALLLPCENEISAHLLRSRLLSHGIPSAVVQDNFATLYGNWLTRPHLLIEEEALEDGLELLAAPDEPLGDNFVELVETADLNEELGLVRAVPEIVELATFGCCAGFFLGVLGVIFLTALAIVASGGQTNPDAGRLVVLLPLICGVGGLVFGIVCWPFIAFARSCRRRDDGSLPLRARLVYLLVPENPLGVVILGVILTMIEMLLSLTGAAF